MQRPPGRRAQPLDWDEPSEEDDPDNAGEPSAGLQLDVTGVVFHWRGPSPHHFVRVPEGEAALIRAVAPAVTYGWGMVPVRARIGDTTFTTALFPKNGGYLVPLKDAVRDREGIGVDDTVTVALTIGA